MKPHKAHGPQRASAAAGPSRPWLFRLLALALPLVVVGMAELGLRLAGYGYATGFLVRTRVAGQARFIDNPDFARRYFPPGLARAPEPVSVPVVKLADTCRIVVLGESAALGDPEPAYGFARQLEVLLEARYPGRKFEVINAAVTAINSHVIRAIAQDCVALKADAWVLYMGNNEVIGPYGAGTVFGAQTPPRALVRAQLAFKTTRIGQALDALHWRLARPPQLPQSWEGMEMFLKQQIRQTDPRMDRVYAAFQHNLQDILRLGARAGARLVVCTLVANLKDCPPFGSLHRPDLTTAELVQWDQWVQEGAAHQAAGRPAAAQAVYQQALRVDDQFAELHFRIGRCQWALGDFAAARHSFQRALDLDTLRFRADSRINQILRQVAQAQAQAGVTLLDAEQVFAQHSPHGVIGNELLWEHVHLNFEGNYLLARTVAEQLQTLLPRQWTSSGSNLPPWLTAEQCAQRLAYTDWDRYQVLDEMFKRLQNPPFTQQLDHAQRLAHLQTQRAALRAATRPPALAQATQTYREALAHRPNDWVLHGRLARLLEASGDLSQAQQHWRRVTELVPHYDQGWYGLANVLDTVGQPVAAAEVFRHLLRRRPNLYEARNGLGLVLASQGQVAEAIAQFQQAIRLRPQAAEASVNLGRLLAQQGQLDQAARLYRQALHVDSNSLAAHVNLGKLLAAQGQIEEAIRHYREAVRINPESAVAHYNLGNALASRHDPQAALHYAEAVRLDPDLLEARLNLGIELDRQGRTAEALAHFQEAVRLRPNSPEAHLHLGTALARLGRYDEAIEQFRETLRLNPAHPAARKFLEQALAARKR